MTTFLLFLIIIFGVGTIITFFIALLAKDNDIRETFSTLCFVLAMLMVISTIGFRIATPEKPHEFSAAKYELKYKVTEFDSVSDTTYVLVPKKNE